jgi:Tol biopolymer transport system component
MWESMSLTSGIRLGPYEILAPIGAGGMGEVYRARDTKLKREVAIKVLPDEFCRDTERVSRFQREAEILASLNHPGIAGIYGLEEASESHFLVLELVEGETLADRIGRGPVPLEEALNVAHGIGDALEAAHEKGIVHRDLKPANVKITPDGMVKVLDFGLAKVAAAQPTSSQDSPTISVAATQAGVILGTAAYMSPEQARGRSVDKRADIWAFGVILFEMLTGRKLFDGDDVTDTLAAVIRAEPPWTAVPPRVVGLLKNCLEKDPKKRLRDIGDAWRLIDHTTPSLSTHAGGKRLWAAVAAVLTITTAAVTLLWVRARSQPPPPLMRFEIVPPAGGGIIGIPQISPDGQVVAFVGSFPGRPNLIYTRRLSEAGARPLPGTEGAVYCFWSPDGRSLGFNVDRELKRIDLAGGTPRILPNIRAGGFNGSWGRHDDILTFFGDLPVVQRLAASAGPLTSVTRLDEKKEEQTHRFPQFLPDGKRFLFYAYTRDDRHNTVELATLGAFERKTLLEGTSAAVYASGPRGEAYLLYMRGETLMAQRFNESGGAMTGEAVAIAENVGRTGAGGWMPEVSASSTGTLVYNSRFGTILQPMQLTWFDRQGNAVEKIFEPDAYEDLTLSPDGTRVAAVRRAQFDRDIWLLELGRGVRTRFTFNNTASDRYPVWSSDGKRIVFASFPAGRFDLYVKGVDDSGDGELLLKTDRDKIPTSWSRDGRYLLYTSDDPKMKNDIWVLPVEGDRKPFLLLGSQFNEGQGEFSPDMHWIAYTSNESGQNEIYVREFMPPGPASLSGAEKPTGRRWQVSKNGGTRPSWREDGKGLIFESMGAVMSVEVSTSPTFRAETPQALFRLPGGGGFVTSNLGLTNAPDLKRFLITVPAPESASPPITVMLNWTAALKN